MDAPVGKIAWFDLTVPDAGQLTGFYEDVVGWTAAEHDMGGYADYMMQAPDGTTAAGICHARGSNAELPACWIPYLTVGSAQVAIDRALARGATLVADRPGDDGQHFAVLQDPAGAYFAVFQAGPVG